MRERRRGRGEEGPSRRHGPQRRAGWLVPASSRHPPPPPTPRPPRGGWRRESTVKSPSAALVKMGTGSSSYRPKAIYLDIDGRIQKVAPPQASQPGAGALKARPLRCQPGGGPSPVTARGPGGGWGPARGRRRGRGRRSSEPASVEPAAALDNSGRGLVGLCGTGVPTRGPVERRDCKGGFFPFRGQSFLCNRSD